MSVREILSWVPLGALPILTGGGYGTLQDHRCLYGSSGCGSDFSCSAGSGTCPDLSTWVSKDGTKVPYNICVSKPNFTCELIPVVCHYERHYIDAGCGTICELINTTTPGCL